MESSMIERARAFVAAACAVLPVSIASNAQTALESTPAARAAVSIATGVAFQADIVSALRALEAVPAEQYAGDDAALRACLLERFGDSPNVATSDARDAFVRSLVGAYRTYWSRVLREPTRRAAEEARLLEELRALLGETAARDWDAVEAQLLTALGERGYHAQLGVTLPLRELLVWSREDTRAYDVTLPEGRHSVTVKLLDEFASQGWTHYALCGRQSAGGWADAEMLYAVRSRYGDLDDEEFQVVLLVHEAQHFADAHRFPGLESWELEYRAKLAELSFADGLREELLLKFETTQGDDPSAPHAYANRRVLGTLRRLLGGDDSAGQGVDLASVPGDDLRRVAKQALIEDSARRASPRA
jgi:hypothetical protein